MRLVDVGGRLVELEIRRSNRVRGSRIVVRPGYPPELVVRPRAGEAEVDAALSEHLPWLERQLARTPQPAARARPPAADRGAGPARGTCAYLAGRPGRSGGARRRVPADHAPRPAQPLGVVLRERHALVQLAARARPARRSRLRRGARGVPPGRAQPRPPLLAARGAPAPGLSPSRRRGSTSSAGRSSRTALPGTPRQPRRLGGHAALGDVRLLRNADRLGRRSSSRARPAVRRGPGGRSAQALSRGGGGASARWLAHAIARC